LKNNISFLEYDLRFNTTTYMVPMLTGQTAAESLGEWVKD